MPRDLVNPRHEKSALQIGYRARNAAEVVNIRIELPSNSQAALNARFGPNAGHLADLPSGPCIEAATDICAHTAKSSHPHALVLSRSKSSLRNAVACLTVSETNAPTRRQPWSRRQASTSKRPPSFGPTRDLGGYVSTVCFRCSAVGLMPTFPITGAHANSTCPDVAPRLPVVHSTHANFRMRSSWPR